jgi:E3 ubiquitin-protein ligase SHPRH
LNKVQALIQLAQLQQHDKSDRARYQHSLEVLLVAEREAVQMVEEIKAVISEHDVKGQLLKKDAAVLQESRSLNTDESHVAEAAPVDNGKGKEKEHDPVDDSSLEETHTPDLPKTPAGEEHAVKRRALVHRLRECNLVLHKVFFLKGDVYHVLGESYSKDEDVAYGNAEELRRKLLKCRWFTPRVIFRTNFVPIQATEQSATQAMDIIAQISGKITERELLLPVPYLNQGGIRSAEMVS